MTNKEKILEGLNDAQKKVAVSIKGAHAVIATAGAGKSTTMVRRAAYMIANGIPASQILIFTFTRKAAQDLKDKVAKIIGNAGKGMWVSTYHSFCAHTLRRYAHLLGYTKSFSIYTETEKTGILTKLVKDLKIKTDANKISIKISEYKEEMLTPDQAAAKASAIGKPEDIDAADIYKEYQKTLISCNAFDFDDLIFQMIKLLEEREDVRREVNNQYRYVTADEVQDSSASNLKLISLLAGPDPSQWNLAMIGDDCQSKE